jgi:hypothetical protein
LDEENGRFHIVHVDEIDMECTSCHIGAGFAADYQLVDKDHAIQKAGGAGKGKQAEVIDRTGLPRLPQDGWHRQPLVRNGWGLRVGLETNDQ